MAWESRMGLRDGRQLARMIAMLRVQGGGALVAQLHPHLITAN